MRTILCVLWRRLALHADRRKQGRGTLSFVVRHNFGGRLTCTADLVHVRLENETALDDFGEDVMCLRNENPGVSRVQAAFEKATQLTSSKWNTRSSSHTFSNALSSDSTNTLGT